MSTRLDEARAAIAEARQAMAEDRRHLDAARRRAPSLFDEPVGPVEAVPVTRAIETVTSHTSTDWRALALAAVRAAAERRDMLTVESVAWPDDLEPYDDRARGGIMRQAARNGWLESTKTYRPSDDPAKHGRPLLVWRSRLRGAAA